MYGFGGQERTPEIGGDGYTAEFWQYDSRLGRRWNVDPVMKPNESPYAAFSNNPIINIDPHGDSDSTVTSPNGGSFTLPESAKILKNSFSYTNKAGVKYQHTEGAVESFSWNDKTYTANYNSKTGEFTGYKAQLGAEFNFQKLDFSYGWIAQLAERQRNSPPEPMNQFEEYRARQAYTGYLEGESKWDRIFRMTAYGSLEARREFASGGMNMFGGYGRLATAAEASPYAGVRSASNFLIEQGVSRADRVTILQSFQVETITLRTADNATFGLRFFDNANAFARGRFLFPTFTSNTSRNGLALPYSWNNMTNFTQWQIPSGSTYIFGRAGAQGSLRGGSYQMVVPNSNILIK